MLVLNLFPIQRSLSLQQRAYKSLILVLNLFPIQRTFSLPTNRYQTLFLCWPCLYSFIIIIFIQESTKQLTMKKLPIVVCFHFKVTSATDYYCHSNYWDLNFRVEFIHDVMLQVHLKDPAWENWLPNNNYTSSQGHCFVHLCQTLSWQCIFQPMNCD